MTGPAEFDARTCRVNFWPTKPAAVHRCRHRHPVGQTLIVIFDRGRVQREGGPVEQIRPGDVVFFEPGEKHWHGAAADTGMSHIAIQEPQDGEVVTWMEHVSDADYGA